MKRALYALVALVVMGYLGVCAFVYARQRSLLDFPQSRAVTAPESTMRLPVDGAELVVTGAASPWPEGHHLLRRECG